MEKLLIITVNGTFYQLPVIPGEMLATLLRERLNLTGTKIGCNEAECGACTVLVGDEAILSCMYPAERANGKEVLTVEGLAVSDETGLHLHPLQEAMISHGAVQCGFCTSGLILSALAYLKKDPFPTREGIRLALKDNLCRCAGYPSIESAIMEAGRVMREGGSIAPTVIPLSKESRTVVGRVQTRPDALQKVTGSAIFTDDLKYPGMLYGANKRSDIPHGILRKVDVSKAKALAGVICVMIAEDIPGESRHGLVIPDWPSIVKVGEKVRYMGDTVAIVAAASHEIAREAVDLIEAEYDPLPIISDPIRALQPDAPKIHDNGNLLKHIKVRKGDIEEGFRQADVILEHVFHTPITEHAFIEPECSIAVPTEDGRLEIHVGSQIPYQDREQVAKALDWKEERVRVVGELMGGGFGGKEDIAGQIHSALLAEKTGKPVKILYDRYESMQVHPKRHATTIRVKIGAKHDGKLTAVETELYGDTGAYASLGEKVMTRATTHSAGPYIVPHVKADCYAMYTNNPPAGAFRGFGVLQSAFAIESMMDILAEKLKIDPVEIRVNNALRAGSITNTGQVLHDSVGLVECLEKVSDEVKKYHGDEIFKPRFSKLKNLTKNKYVRAWGIAAAYKNTGLGGGAIDNAGAELEAFMDGTVEIRSSSAELGQGLVSVMQMIVAEELGLPLGQVKVLVMDTDLTPDGGPTTASRQTYVTGNATRLATIAMRESITRMLAEKFDVSPVQIKFINGHVEFGNERMPFKKLVELMVAEGIQTKSQVTYESPKTKPLGDGGDMHFAFAFASQAAEVEVNITTGEVRVLQVVAANDVGMAVNPMGIKGQVEGGIMMGLGHALMEEFIVEKGIVITDRLAKYKIPSIIHTPEITSFLVEHPTREGPYGAKGIGEIVSIPTVAAITNAIYNAVGVRVDHLPVDQEHILWEIKKKYG